MDLIKILERIASPDAAESGNGKQRLEEAVEDIQLMENLLMKLSDMFLDSRQTGLSTEISQVAGYQLANALSSSSPEFKKKSEERWFSLETQARTHIKNNILIKLRDPDVAPIFPPWRPNPAILCLTNIATIELPLGLWPELIFTLVEKISVEASETIRVTSLEALGYLCLKINAEAFGDSLNTIFQIIILSMKNKSTFVAVAAAHVFAKAIKAFRHLLLENDKEKLLLFESLTVMLNSEDPEVQSAGLDCLEITMSSYYVFIANFMEKHLITKTLDIIKSENGEIRKKGIDFWAGMCKKEKDFETALELHNGFLFDENGYPDYTDYIPDSSAISPISVVRSNLPQLANGLLQAFTKQPVINGNSEFQSLWSACKCLILLTHHCGELLTIYVTDFVIENIMNPAWQYRIGAMKAFGCVIKGEQCINIKMLINPVLDHLPFLMGDSNVKVKRATAAALRCLFEAKGTIADIILTDNRLKDLLEHLIYLLDEELETAYIACEAIQSFFLLVGETANAWVNKKYLKNCFDTVTLMLLQRLLVKKSIENDVRNYIFCTYEIMIENIVDEYYEVTLLALNKVIAYLDSCVNQTESIKNDCGVKQHEYILAFHLASLKVLLVKMNSQDVIKMSDKVMANCFDVLKTPVGDIPLIETFEVVASTARQLKEKFFTYLSSCMPLICNGLSVNKMIYEPVYTAVLNTTSDIILAVGPKFLRYCAEILNLLMHGFKCCDVHNLNLQPKILSVISDVATAVGKNFMPYSMIILPVLFQTVEQVLEEINLPHNRELTNFYKELRKQCFKLCTITLSTIKEDKEMQSQINLLHKFITKLK